MSSYVIPVRAELATEWGWSPDSYRGITSVLLLLKKATPTSLQACEKSCFKALLKRLSSSSGEALLRAEVLHLDYTFQLQQTFRTTCLGPIPRESNLNDLCAFCSWEFTISSGCSHT